MVRGTEFRDVMSRFATGVTVVAARDPVSAEPRGLTANAFCSVSLDPPLVLVCVSEDCGTYEVIRRANHFSVNVLAEEQAEVSRVFAGRGPRSRFQDVGYTVERTGAPILRDALAWLDCSLWATYPGGDHAIFVGRVESLGASSVSGAPLLFYGGRYGSLSPDPAEAALFQAG